MKHSPWVRFVRIAGLVVGVLAGWELAAWLVDAASRGWPFGFWGSLPIALADMVEGLPWYFPAGALVGGIAMRRNPAARAPRWRETGAVAVGIAGLSFILRGYIGPHLLHSALARAVPDLAAPRLVPNDWGFLRSLVAEGGVAPDTAHALLAEIHATVAFAILAGLMLFLGLAIGRIALRFAGPVRRRMSWAMAAAATLLVYGAQVATWQFAVAGPLPAATVVYVGFLTVPSVMLLTLFWAGFGSGSGVGPAPASPRP